MKPKIKLGDTVKFPKYLIKEKNYPKTNLGLVINIEGVHYEVQPKGCWWVVKFDECELGHISRWGGTEKQLKQFRIKFNNFRKFMIDSEGNI